MIPDDPNLRIYAEGEQARRELRRQDGALLRLVGAGWVLLGLLWML